MLPEPVEFDKYFHKLFRQQSDINRKHGEWRKARKKTTKPKDKRKNKLELVNDSGSISPPDIEVPANASSFAMFASVRLAVLERWMRQANQEYLQSSCCAPMQDISEMDSDSEDDSRSSTYVPMRVSKVVGLGLRSVFELIRESRSSHPMLCTKALTALLDVLQGQTPEGLKSEPPDVIDPLFDLLLDLATSQGSDTFSNDGNHLTAIACACLLSLVVVRGDTGKYLAAIAALLMCPRTLASQNIKMPGVLTALQRSVHGVLLGKIVRPEWISHGVPRSAKICSFFAALPPEVKTIDFQPKSMASDGQYLYVYSYKGLFKIGSGLGGTMRGHLYVWKPDFYPGEKGWLGYCNGNLYLKFGGKRCSELLIIDKNTLYVTGTISLDHRNFASSIIFSDGENLATISPAKDDGFVVRSLNPSSSPAMSVGELPLKLARKCVDILGVAAYDEEGASHTVNTGSDEEIATIVSGKEFGLIKTTTGKVLYCGKAAALGIKQAGVKTGKWSELCVTKSPKVTHIAIGHDGMHAVLLTEDGGSYFTGTARRGEDGDQSKTRRQPKPVKPKKIIKVDGQFITHAACNNGTTALVTKDGELLMFGKDTAHADPSTGLVCNLKGEFVTQVALGKAHAVALTNKGHIYTFGINNKFQCGRDFNSVPKEGCSSNVVAMDTGAINDEGDAEEPVCNGPYSGEENNPAGTSNGISEQRLGSRDHLCPPGKHAWKHDMCMVCTVCRECTGYSISCLSAMRPDRNPGQECGCGEGDSGCHVCGCCRMCAQESVDNSEMAVMDSSGGADIADRHAPRVQDFRKRIEGRLRKSIANSSKQSGLKMKPSNRPVSSLSSVLLHNALKHSTFASNSSSNSIGKEPAGSDAERDTTRIACLPPAKLVLPSESPAVQIGCGLHHSVVLLQNGLVYTFGSNQYGQLGCGDILAQAGVQLVKLPCPAVHVAAGSNHTVILTIKGEVYTFGNYQKGQLGRHGPGANDHLSTSSKFVNPRCPWYSMPSTVPNLGPRYGRRATWVGASGDQTFLKIDESLINSISLAKSTIIANKSSIVLLPYQSDNATSFKSLVINKHDGNCNSFSGKTQVDFCNIYPCLDPLYNVLWAFDPSDFSITCYNAVASDIRTVNSNNDNNSNNNNNNYKVPVKEPVYNKLTSDFDFSTILCPELALPVTSNCYIMRLQAAIHLLGCLDTLAVAHDLRMSTIKEEIEDRQLIAGKTYSREDFQMVNRFESHGGGWGYSGHSIEAVRFMVDTDVLLGGFGLFGGRGEYTGKIKLLDIGTEGGDQEGDGEVLAETEEIPYECGPRQKYPMLFDEPVSLQAHRWYVAWCRISGPSSDCGSSGQAMITTEDQVIFYFKSSKKSNNGTDVNAGQIPQMLYRVVTPENQNLNRPSDQSEPVYILSKEFSRTVTKECFQSLLSLLQWSWNAFKLGVMDAQTSHHFSSILEHMRLVYVSRACLRLIRTYTNEIYPNHIAKKIPLESVHLAESVGDVRSLLKQILSDALPAAVQFRRSAKSKSPKANMFYVQMMNGILEECHNTFVACFHAFYPTAYLKWTCLCDLLSDIDKETELPSLGNSERLLSAVISALSGPSVRLRSTFPLLTGSASIIENSLQKGLSPSDNTGLPMMPGSDIHHYPILVEQMSYRSQMETANSTISWSWKEVLDRLISLVSEPTKQALLGHRVYTLPGLTKNCCFLLARVIAELVHQCNASDEELQGACGRVLHTTPSRFTRTNQSRTWNTGNGSPDAICFHVDRVGVSIVGVFIYGGLGHYEYELELLEDQSSVSGGEGHGHAQRWFNLDSVRGSFGPEDYSPDLMEVKFERPIPIKENIKYAFRLRNHGGRTSNGDGGLSVVKGPDGTSFTFSTCSLSFNGTTQTRGQIPHILYYSNPQDSETQQTSRAMMEMQAKKCTLSMTSTVVNRCGSLLAIGREKADDVPVTDILGGACIITTLMPLVCAHISSLATSDPRSGVQILMMIQEILPHISALNLLAGSNSGPESAESTNVNTSGQHYTWVQSEHPYKSASVSNYKVSFPESVKWMSLEFDSSCGTAQPEDYLQLHVPSAKFPKNTQPFRWLKYSEEDEADFPLPFWSVGHKYSASNNQWPQAAVVLPGHEVIFSLETASDYLKDDRASSYGFKCLAVGYEWPFWPTNVAASGLKHLEAEMSFLGGMCAASLMKKDLQLTIFGSDELEGDVDMVELMAQQTLITHSSLLSKGLALSSPLTITQALDGVLPISSHSNERLFLRDFVSCAPGTSGGRLALWLQPGSRVDPSRCQVIYNREELRAGWPAIVTVFTRDQYGDLVNCPNMKVEVKAVPIDKKDLGDSDHGKKLRRVCQPDSLTFGGQPVPTLHFPYEPTVKDKMCFHSITMMKAYQNYSFEELRYTYPPVKRSSENMLVRPNADGTYSATWTPACIGCYSVIVTIDGYEMEETYKVEVREPPQGIMPPSQNIIKKPSHQPSKLRKFVAKNSAGLRVRAHPSLQSEQLGIVHVNGTIAFIDEVHNDDGVWLRLSMDTIKQYCSASVIEAWCLQYNQHLGKTLLLPVEEPRTVLDQDGSPRKLSESHSRSMSQMKFSGVYQVVKCGASGHNVRSKSSLKAPPVGMLVLGNQIAVTEYIVNSDGHWVSLDAATKEKYCFNNDGDAWTLVMGHNNALYLRAVLDSESEIRPHLPSEASSKKAFDFTNASPSNAPDAPFTFRPSSTNPFVNNASASTDIVFANPFVFGDAGDKPDAGKVVKREKQRPSAAHSRLKSEEDSSTDKENREESSNPACVSVMDLVKAIRQSKTNGNGATPPDTPKRSLKSLSPKVPSRSSSPVGIITKGKLSISQSSLPTYGPDVQIRQGILSRAGRSGLEDSNCSSSIISGSPRSAAVSPLVAGPENTRRGSNQSDTSAMASSLSRDLSQSPSHGSQSRDAPSPAPSSSSVQSKSDASSMTTSNRRDCSDDSPRILTQTGTQTSPENMEDRTRFAIGANTREERTSPKPSRKDRSSSSPKSKTKRSMSPVRLQSLPGPSSKMTIPTGDPVKQAVSPSVAESIRAVFASFLWHEGIVHDAMACASFLKFHPNLPKQGAVVVTRHAPSADPPVDKRKTELTREEKARQRHSVEVSTAGNYLHIQPSTLETLTRSAANANANRNRTKKVTDAVIREEEKLQENVHTVSVLPPALKSLVYLWEELSSTCLQAIMQQLIVSSPIYCKLRKQEKSNRTDSLEKEKSKSLEKENRKNNRGRKKEWNPMYKALDDLGLSNILQQASCDRETLCDLCGENFPHPVTHHMRAAHPGCGAPAGGKGYNSGGNYCVGWAGNCGDGGVAGSSWYLVCDACREKYMKAMKPSSNKVKNRTRKKGVTSMAPMKMTISPSTSVGGVEAHIIMKNNAMFLLDLASAANIGISHRRRPSVVSSPMPPVFENASPPDNGGPFGPIPPFQCLRSLNAVLPYDEPFYNDLLQNQKYSDGFPGSPSSSGQRPLSEISFTDEAEYAKGMKFHRSVSMGINGGSWTKSTVDGRLVVLRKRNNSSCENLTDSGSSLLCNPSAALQRLVPFVDKSAIVSQQNEQHKESLHLLQRPVLSFLLQQHDLEALLLSMKQALRKATCRVYAMQALNWLLRSVTQPVCLHDLLWWFVTSLSPTDIEIETEDDNKPVKRPDDLELNVCEHPLSDLWIAGEAIQPLSSTFHSLLQTIADLMVLLPMGSSLQQMAVRCWGLRFTQADHTFLHRSKVFSNISKILSRSEEMEDCCLSLQDSHHSSSTQQATVMVECYKDVTSFVEIKASSRQAMVGSLTDNSTETFWESGEEDRNKTKCLTISCAPNHHPKMICLHIDNCRDLANKVSSITFFSGNNSDELAKLRTVDVESRLIGGWFNCPVLEHNHTVLRVELKGPDNSLRIRQIRILGEVAGESLQVGKLLTAMSIQQRNCESETLRVFRLITSQVFGKLITGDNDNRNSNQNDSGSGSASESMDPLEDSNDLREHMVGILFSRSKLTHLQKQVIVHIVQAIRKETIRVREEWELLLCSASGTGSGSSAHSMDTKSSDTYCFEMLSMVLALSGSSVGRAYLSHQFVLLGDLISLLHTGSARVQRQVTSLLRRMLPEISPELLAKVMEVDHLPPADFSIITAVNKSNEGGDLFDEHRIGILDAFLSVIAKALTVQVKVKNKDGNPSGSKGVSTVTLATSIHPRDYLGNRWWLRGCVSRKLAEVIVVLMKDMAAGKLSEAWANATKGAIAENILNLTRLTEEQRNPTACLHTPTLWLALASLCVLDQDHVERLSSGQWSSPEGQSAPPRPTCTNHDDGETNAIIQCNTCGNLCADCDRVLHLHRKTRMHQRQVCKEEEEAIKVELHEGCGRTKLFWLLALADARTLKALVEYREGGTRTRGAGASGMCRFCGTTGSSGLLAIGNVCADQECQEYSRSACNKLLGCGHMCGGVQNETNCLPCLYGCSAESSLRQDADDMCMICFTEALSCAPAIQLKCGHVFHLHCCKAVLTKKWAGPRITFSFSQCPICKSHMEHSVLKELLAPIQELFNDVKRKALMRLEYEGLHVVEAITAPGARFHNDPSGYAMDRYAYYVCFKCNKAYFGGEARCDVEAGENYDPAELVCGACSDVARAQMCPKHGTDFLEYKCRYCCSVAVFFCFGTTHFCNPCHDDFQRVTTLSRSELPNCPAGPKAKQLEGDECPLHIKHPPTGEEFALGCGVCRNAHTF